MMRKNGGDGQKRGEKKRNEEVTYSVIDEYEYEMNMVLTSLWRRQLFPLQLTIVTNMSAFQALHNACQKKIDMTYETNW